MIPKSIAPSDSKLAGMPRMVSPRKVARSASGMMIATIPAEGEHAGADEQRREQQQQQWLVQGE
jgi:hypothetical protein